MKSLNRFLRPLLRAATVLLTLALASVAWAAAAGEIFTESHAKIRDVIALQEEVTGQLLKWPDVLGTAVGLSQAGQPDLVVYVDSEGLSKADVVRALPPQLRGIAMRAEFTEKFVSYKGRPGGGGGTSHTALQNPPVQLGTSGGWRNDLANGYCCGGTLGSLIQVNNAQFIMSNYHVFESDIVPGGNNVVATTGSYVIQPGLIDVRCSASSAQNVATLLKLSSLPDSNVDVSIAQVVPGMVRGDGAILEIGTLSSQTVAAFLNQAVKKSGRTTGLSRSYINGLNATVSVQYENECAGGVAFTKTFTNQVLVANGGSGFLNSGDSGSLMVEDVTTSPHAVGLLFAGSSTIAVANPISPVLQFIGSKMGGTATMVGN